MKSKSNNRPYKVMFLFFMTTLALSPLHAQRFYSSNSIGMTKKEISSSQVDDFEFVLEIASTSAGEQKLLYKNGLLTKQWNREFEYGVLVKESIFDSDGLVSVHLYEEGRLMEEHAIEAGRVVEKKEYRYDQDALSSIRVVDENEELLYEDLYATGVDGRLRSIRRLGGDDIAESAFRYAVDQLVEEWHGVGGAGVLYRYRDRELVLKEHWTGLELTRVEEILKEDGREKRTSIDENTGTIVIRYYDSANKILEEITETQGERVEHVAYLYRESLLIRRTRLTESLREVWKYDYDESDTLKIETYLKNSATVKITNYTGPDSYFEEIYNRQGIPVLRVYFEDDLKIKEEPIQQTKDES